MTLVKAEPFYPGESNPQTSQQDSDFVYIVTNNKPATVIKYSKNGTERLCEFRARGFHSTLTHTLLTFSPMLQTWRE